MSNTDSDSTLYLGNLDEQVTEMLLYELFLQFAPVKGVKLPKDKVTRKHQGYGFVTFYNVDNAQYVMKLIDGLNLYGNSMKVRGVTGSTLNSATTSSNANNEVIENENKIIDDDFGPIIYIGNLDSLVDIETLNGTFSNFGKFRRSIQIIKNDVNCHAFINFQTFENADEAIKDMNGKMIMNKPITIDYAFKKGSKVEKHGDQVERLLWEKAKQNNFLGREEDKKSILNNIRQQQKPEEKANDWEMDSKSNLNRNSNSSSNSHSNSKLITQQHYQNRSIPNRSQYAQKPHQDYRSNPNPTRGGYNNRGYGYGYGHNNGYNRGYTNYDANGNNNTNNTYNKRY